MTPAGDVQNARAIAGAMGTRMQALRGLRNAAGKREPAGVVQGAGETVPKQRVETVRDRNKVQIVTLYLKYSSIKYDVHRGAQRPV